MFWATPMSRPAGVDTAALGRFGGLARPTAVRGTGRRWDLPGRFFAAALATGSLACTLLAFAGSARAEFLFDPPTNLGPIVNSSAWDGWPAVSPDGLELYISSLRVEGGSGYCDIWVATRATTDDDFGPPALVPSPVSTDQWWDQEPDLSADGLTLYYVSHDSDNWDAGDEIFYVTRPTTASPWADPVKLGPNVNTVELNEVGPNISADGLELYFARNPGPPDDLTTYDLWLSTRATDTDPWGPAVALGISLPGYYDSDPSLSPDDLALFFSSNRPGEMGNIDVWVATRQSKSAPWEQPVNLGSPVNTPDFDGPADLSADGKILYFTHGTHPSGSDVDIWQARRSIPGDMNGDGDVDFDDIDAFVLGLSRPTAYESLYGVPPSWKGDMDSDGDADFDDISGFVALLTGGSAGGRQVICEPSTCLLGGGGLLIIGLYRRRHCRRRDPPGNAVSDFSARNSRSSGRSRST